MNTLVELFISIVFVVIVAVISFSIGRKLGYNKFQKEFNEVIVQALADAFGGEEDEAS